MPDESKGPVSILGIDPGQAPVAPAQEEAKPPEPPKGVSLTDQQYQALLDKARNYETIMQDPQAGRMIHDYYQTKIATHASGLPPVGSSPQSQPTAPSPEGNDVQSLMNMVRQQGEAIQQGIQTINNLQNALGTVQLEMFKSRNPDYGQVEGEVIRILREVPQIGLPRAYELAKARAGQQQPSNGQTAQASPAARAAEGRGAGELPDLGDAIARAEQRIGDRKAFPSSESAYTEAIRLARQIHGA